MSFNAPIDQAVEAQLKYDTTRTSLVSYLYGVCSSFTQLNEILWLFVEAAGRYASKLYYPGAEPDAKGNCPWCSQKLTR